MSYFLGIYREPEYSPGRHTSNDVLILRLVGQALEQQGVSVKLVFFGRGAGSLAGCRFHLFDVSGTGDRRGVG
jgi:hypothetical protein